MDNPKVSVIVPVYNTARYLRQCLNSLKNQTLDNCEFLCVNDGSTDNSASILKEYAQQDNRFRIIEQVNSGVSTARNTGLKNAKGDYICFVDSDDYIDLNQLENTYKLALDNNADIVVFGGTCFPTKSWADNNLNTKSTVFDNNIINVLFNQNGSRPFVWNKLFKATIIKNNKIIFDRDLTIGEDQAFVFDVFPYAKKVVFTDKKFYYYRQQYASAMANINSNPTNKLKEHINLVESIVTSWKKRNLISKYGNQLLKWIVVFLNIGIKDSSYNFRKYVYSNIKGFANRIAEYVPLNDESIKIIGSIENFGKNNPKVSVIMPVYNAAAYLDETLQCMNRQTFEDYELIIVDDGSTDESFSKLEAYAANDDRVILKKQEHQFAGAARNLGIGISQGEYLLFLDSDDFFHPNMIEHAYREAKKMEADICVFVADRVDQESKKRSPMPWTMQRKLCPKDRIFSKTTNSKNIFWFTTPAPWNKLFKREFVINHGLCFQKTRSANDMAFVMTALAIADRIVPLDETLLTYRVNNKLSLQGSQNKKPDAFYEALIELKRRLKYYNVFNVVKEAFVNFSLDFCFYNLGTLRTEESYNNIYSLIKNEALEKIEALGKTREYFYAYPFNKIWQKLNDIQNLTAFEFAVKYNAPYLKANSKTIIEKINREKAEHMNEPIISIVLPSLNVAPYIDECLQSVLAQTYKNLEIICVDAGSTDGTKEIIEFYKERDSRIQLINSDRKSYGYQVNLGLKTANGKYFAIIATDDFINHNMMDNLVKTMEANQLDFVKANFCKFSGDGANRKLDHFSIAPDKSLYNKVLNPAVNFQVFKALICTRAGIYSTQYLKENNIWHNESPGASYQDHGFWFQTLIYAKRIMLVDNECYNLRRDNPNSSFFSKEKAYCTCGEYDFIRNILAKNRVLESKFAGLCAFYRYSSYNSVLEKIIDNDKLDFLRKFSADFKKIISNGELEPSLFTAYDKDQLLKIVFDPEYFYYYNHETDDLGRYPIDNLEDTDKIAILKKWLANSDKKVDSIKKAKSKITNNTKKDENSNKIKRLEKELNDIKSGYSFRIGRIITYLPRIILGKK